MKNKDLLNRVKNVVKKIDQSAEIYLYGSRARKDFQKDSDWDFLIITPKHFDYNFKRNILNEVYNIELESNVIINTIIVNKDEWNNSINSLTSFFKNVQQERIRI